MTDSFDLLPKDPAMLMSYLNTKLRDEYASLDELCEDMHIDRARLTKALADGGFEYDPSRNRVW